MLLPPTLVFESDDANFVECEASAPLVDKNGVPTGAPCMDIHYTEAGRPLVTAAYLASLDGWRQDPLIASALYKQYPFMEEESRDGTAQQSLVAQADTKPQAAPVADPTGGPTGDTTGDLAGDPKAEPAAERSPRFYLYGDAKSSLDVAHDLARQGKLEPWDAVMVTSQSEGRGQLRRDWSSPCGNLYAAWRLPLEFPMTEGYAALVVGSMLAEALSTIRIPIELKWPNDIILKGKKVGGILLEERGGVLLAGIGINVFSAPHESALREDHAMAATCLRDEGFHFATPLTLFCSLVNMGRFWYGKQVHDENGARFPQCMEKYLAWRHQNIVVHGGNSDIKNGTIVGIAPCGGLKVIHNGVEKILDSGSIVLEY
ncbi:MAG: biotin--[acetyl-CoA-carboxylase] ligase [Pseudomonadota bacterium]